MGEIPDLVPFARWMRAANLNFAQLLPINEMDHAHNSPYAALSAMAIDPLYIALDDVREFHLAGGKQALSSEARDALAVARSAATLAYDAIRSAKTAALHLAFAAFERGTGRPSSRVDDFQGFLRRDGWWLDDYALFRALHDENGGCYWREWEEGVRERRPEALRDARTRLARPIRYHAYVQWVADEQWAQMRRHSGVALFGDFPFMVSGHSADVWSRQHEFRLDASVGVPPDASSPAGQDWGLPAYRWDVIAPSGYQWLCQRARRCAFLFDGFRIDHLVGFYRTYVWERDGAAAFVPADESEQIAQGETVLRLFKDAGARIIAEDLGTVPEGVRESMARLGVPGLKVLRWERDWNEAGQPFRELESYPADSVATTGTHDTETLAEWWDTMGGDERRGCAATRAMRAAGLESEEPFSPRVRDCLLNGVFSARSELRILPLQDIFGWRERINNPAATDGSNWTWRLPWPVEDLVSRPEAVERAAFLRRASSTFL